jgi:hypothetical protein
MRLTSDAGGFHVALGQVLAGAETASGAGDEQAAHRGLGLGARHRLGEPLVDGGVEGIELFRAVERYAQHPGQLRGIQ